MEGQGLGMMKYIFGIFFFLLMRLTFAQPNILWLTCEDISPTLSMYGDSTAKTPNLDRLAAESMIFTEAFSTVGVCGPSRSSLITGMYPISIGTQNMRAGKDIMGWGARIYDGKSEALDIDGNPVPHYSAVIPAEVKCFSEYLRAAGYYCTNNPKTDYQFAAPVTAWDENGKKAHYKNRNEGQPFFAIFNHEVTHESQIWKRNDQPLTVDPKEVPLPPYYPNDEVVRQDVARLYSNIEVLDLQIGVKLKELEEAGLLDKTIIFFFSDHGGPLPRGKREHYESGLRVPLMVRLPDRLKQEFVNTPVSFVDFAPTILSLAGIPIPHYLQGQAFLGDQKAETDRQCIFGSGDRFDEYSDQIRSVISKDFVYVRNYHPELPAYKDVGYRKNIPMMNQMLGLYADEALNDDQEYWLRKTKTAEEFYVRSADPFSLNNLIDDDRYATQITEMQVAMDEWLTEVGDKGAIPERELLFAMWPDGIQPLAETPKIKLRKNCVQIASKTEGSSLAYIVSKEKMEPNLDSGWKVYTKPVELKKGEIIYAMTTRIGFKDSQIVSFQKR